MMSSANWERGRRSGMGATALSIIGALLASIQLTRLNGGPFPYDEAHYAEASALIWLNGVNAGGSAYEALISAVGFKPPLLSWLGALVIPMTRALGPQIPFQLIEFAMFALVLLLGVVIARCARISWWVTAGIIAALGSNVLLLGLSSHFFVETLQSAVVLATVLIVVLRVTRQITWTQFWLFALTSVSLGLLIKTTTPLLQLLVIASGLALWILRRRDTGDDSHPEPRRSWVTWTAGSLAIVSFVACALWYSRNWEATLRHAYESSIGSVAQDYGSAADFGAKLSFWASQLIRSVSGDPAPMEGSPAVSIAILISLVGLISLVWQITRGRSWSPTVVVLGGSVIPSVCYLVTLTRTINEDPRFIAPAICLLAVALGALAQLTLNARFGSVSPIRNGARQLLTAGVVVWIALGAVVGVNAVRQWIPIISGAPAQFLPPYLAAPTDSQGAGVWRLVLIAGKLCNTDDRASIRVVGVERPEFNANTMEFLSAYRALGGEPRCSFTSLGYTQNSVERALRRLDELPANQVVFPADWAATSNNADQFNQVNAGVFSALSESADWSRATDAETQTIIFTRAG